MKNDGKCTSLCFSPQSRGRKGVAKDLRELTPMQRLRCDVNTPDGVCPTKGIHTYSDYAQSLLAHRPTCANHASGANASAGLRDRDCLSGTSSEPVAKLPGTAAVSPRSRGYPTPPAPPLLSGWPNAFTVTALSSGSWSRPCRASIPSAPNCSRRTSTKSQDRRQGALRSASRTPLTSGGSKEKDFLSICRADKGRLAQLVRYENSLPYS
jgi:hypothetical protein